MDRGVDYLTRVYMSNLIRNVIGDDLDTQESNAMAIQKSIRSGDYGTPWEAVRAFVDIWVRYCYRDIGHHTQISAYGGRWAVDAHRLTVFKAHRDCDGGVFYQFC